MALLAKQSSSLAPAASVTYGAASASDTFANGGQERLHVKNGGGSPDTVTVNSVKNCDQGFDHDVVVSVPAGQDRWIGPFDPGRFTDPATGLATVTHSFITSVTQALLG